MEAPPCPQEAGWRWAPQGSAGCVSGRPGAPAMGCRWSPAWLLPADARLCHRDHQQPEPFLLRQRCAGPDLPLVCHQARCPGCPGAAPRGTHPPSRPRPPFQTTAHHAPPRPHPPSQTTARQALLRLPRLQPPCPSLGSLPPPALHVSRNPAFSSPLVGPRTGFSLFLLSSFLLSSRTTQVLRGNLRVEGSRNGSLVGKSRRS